MMNGIPTNTNMNMNMSTVMRIPTSMATCIIMNSIL